MQQSTIGALALSVLVVSFITLADYGSPIAAQNVAQTMVGTGAFVGSSAPANVSGSGNFSNSPANPTPSTNTPVPASSQPSSGDDKKTEDTKDKPSCSVEKEKEEQKTCDARNSLAKIARSPNRYELKKTVKESKGAPSCTYTCVNISNQNMRKCSNGKLATRVELADGKTNDEYCDEDPVYGQSAGSGAPCLCSGSIGSTGRQWSQLAAVGSIAAGVNQCAPSASGCGFSNVYDASNGPIIQDAPQAPAPGGNVPNSGVNQGAGGAFGGNGQPVPKQPVAANPSGVGTGLGSQTPPASGLTEAQGAGNNSSPASNGQSNPVYSGGGGGGNPATLGGTAGVGNGGGNYGPLSGNYNSLQQFQPYGGSNNGLGRIADNFGQQPSYGYNQNYGNAYTQPTATAGRGGLGGAIGNFINNLVGNNNGAPTPAPAQGVVFFDGQPVASYTTKDGSIVIDKVRVPRQTPQGNSATPEDLVQALSASDVSVAARIRSEVASGTLTLAIPSGGDGTNQAYTNIQNLIVQDEVQAALQIAEDAGIAAKDSVYCEVDEAASDCLARRIATAQEVERRVFVDELHRRALEPNAVAHFVGVYDNAAHPGSGQQYSGASQSVLAQLNNPSTSVVGTVVDAVGAAIDSVVSFIANLF